MPKINKIRQTLLGFLFFSFKLLHNASNMANRDHMGFEQGIQEKDEKFQHLEAPAPRHSSLPPDSMLRASFDRRHSESAPASRRESIRRSFDKANLAMVFPDSTHIEVNDDKSDQDIDDIAVSWYVWLISATASIAGSLFGYDTGIISAVLVYLNNDLNKRPLTASEKELITSLCSGGAFIGSIIAGLTADKVGDSSSAPIPSHASNARI